jgi:hypothetical protein
MPLDLELEAWRREWQAQPAAVPDLQRQVARRIRAARISLAIEILVTIVFGAGVSAWAMVTKRLDLVVLAVGVWVFLIITWITSLALARGTWRPSARTAAAFLEFSALSCQRSRQAIAAAAVIYAALLAFVLGWKYLTLAADVSVPVFLMSGSNLTVWAITAFLAAAGVHRRRALARELNRLRELRDAMRHLHRAIE